MMKTVLITGASRGIGAATARLFAQNGYAVAVHYHRRADCAEALVKELTENGADAFAVCADIADAAAVKRMVGEVLARFGHVDVLVNNAGISASGLVTDVTDADWERMMAVNLSGAFYTCRAVLPSMIARKSGAIVQVSSMWGEVGASCEVAYSTAKAGLIGLTKALAKEVAPSGIRVNCVTPGVIATEMNAHLSEEDMAVLCDETPCGRIGTPEEIAQSILFLSDDRASFITGQILGVNGGMVI